MTSHPYGSRPGKSSPLVGARHLRRRPAVEQLEDRLVPAVAFGLTTTNGLYSFDTATAFTVSDIIPVTGLKAANEQLEGIDFRPADGKLYALGRVSGTSDLRLYTVNTQTGAATQVGNAPLQLDTAKVTNPSDLGTNFGLDFNPVVDRLRVVTDTGRNFRVDPNTGLTVDADTATAGVQFDADLNPAGFSVVALAYTKNTPGAASTTLFGYDFRGEQLVQVGGPNGTPSPNTGTTTAVGPSGLGSASPQNLGLDVRTEGGVDTAFLSEHSAGGDTTDLYTVNLATGTATKVGLLNDGTDITRDIALTPSTTGTTPTGTTPPTGNPTPTGTTTGTPAGTATGTPAGTGTTPSGLPAGTDLTPEVGIDFPTRTRVGRGRSRVVRITQTVNNPTAIDYGPVTGKLAVRTGKGRRRRPGSLTQTATLGPNGTVTFTFTVNLKTTSVGDFSLLKG
jgi:Domain of unknown function (DUF4394)